VSEASHNATRLLVCAPLHSTPLHSTPLHSTPLHSAHLSVNGGVAGHGRRGLLRVRTATSRDTPLGRVRIVRFKFLSAEPFDVAVCGLSVAPIAASVNLAAADNLLRGENQGGSGDPHDVGLELLGCGERPARSALSLVLDRGGEGSGPVNKVGSVNGGEASQHVLPLGGGGEEVVVE